MIPTSSLLGTKPLLTAFQIYVQCPTDCFQQAPTRVRERMHTQPCNSLEKHQVLVQHSSAYLFLNFILCSCAGGRKVNSSCFSCCQSLNHYLEH